MRRRAGGVLLALVAGCALVRFEQPDVRLDGVRLSSISLRGGTLNAQLMVSNPNRFALRSTALDLALDLGDSTVSATGWTPVANATLERELNVGAHDSTVVNVPVDFTYQGVGSVIHSLIAKGTFDYRITGSLRVTQPLSKSVPFRHTGRISLNR